MIQLTRVGTDFSGSAEELESLRIQFDQQNCVQLPTLLEPELLEQIQRQVAQAKMYEASYLRGGTEARMAHNVALDLLYLLTNDPMFIQIIQRITGCGKIRGFTGRIYRMVPSCGHHALWHNDMLEDRMIAMSINLTSESYSGGILQIRDKNSQRIVQEVANTGSGDGIIFRLDEALEHRITDVEGTVPKTAFAGWFRSKTDFLSLLKQPVPEPQSSD